MNKLIIAVVFLASAMSAPIPNSVDHHLLPISFYNGLPVYNYAAPLSQHYGPSENNVPAYYGFGYGVNDPYHGVSFGHNENKDGYKTTGAYYVSLPDNRLQQVSYYADHTGYHPTVTYVYRRLRKMDF